MKRKTLGLVKINLGSIFLIVSILVSLFWWVGRHINVYQFKLTGIVFEILWLPAIAALLIIPIISLILWTKEKYTLKSFYPYSILIIATTIFAMILSS